MAMGTDDSSDGSGNGSPATESEGKIEQVVLDQDNKIEFLHAMMQDQQKTLAALVKHLERPGGSPGLPDPAPWNLKDGTEKQRSKIHSQLFELDLLEQRNLPRGGRTCDPSVLVPPQRRRPGTGGRVRGVTGSLMRPGGTRRCPGALARSDPPPHHRTIVERQGRRLGQPHRRPPGTASTERWAPEPYESSSMACSVRRSERRGAQQGGTRLVWLRSVVTSAPMREGTACRYQKRSTLGKFHQFAYWKPLARSVMVPEQLHRRVRDDVAVPTDLRQMKF